MRHLEMYADHGSRLERGKRYVRTGIVIDLQIWKSRISARVQRRRKSPYKLEILISPLDEAQCEAILEQCSTRVENLEALLHGTFSPELKGLFRSENGLFPAPREISFVCSCPDFAIMCKHVGAALYGVSARLDEDPLLFFELCGINPGRFIDVALANKVDQMLENADQPSSRIIEDANLTDLFGVL